MLEACLLWLGLTSCEAATLEFIAYTPSRGPGVVSAVPSGGACLELNATVCRELDAMAFFVRCPTGGPWVRIHMDNPLPVRRRDGCDDPTQRHPADSCDEHALTCFRVPGVAYPGD